MITNSNRVYFAKVLGCVVQEDILNFSKISSVKRSALKFHLQRVRIAILYGLKISD